MVQAPVFENGAFKANRRGFKNFVRALQVPRREVGDFAGSVRTSCLARIFDDERRILVETADIAVSFPGRPLHVRRLR